MNISGQKYFNEVLDRAVSWLVLIYQDAFKNIHIHWNFSQV